MARVDETGPALLARSFACESFVDLAGKERFARVDLRLPPCCVCVLRSSRRGGGVGAFGGLCVCVRARPSRAFVSRWLCASSEYPMACGRARVRRDGCARRSVGRRL